MSIEAKPSLKIGLGLAWIKIHGSVLDNVNISYKNFAKIFRIGLLHYTDKNILDDSY